MPEITYRCEPDDAGTFTIRDVPIMGEVPKGEKGNESPVGKEWLEAALAKLQTRAAEGYLPPLHLRHHDWGAKAERAGVWRATRVGEIAYDGGKMWAIFADLELVPEATRAAMARGEWPYRSVEIHSYAEHEIGSLALLDSEAPFFKFPLLRLASPDPLDGDDGPMLLGADTERVTPYRGAATSMGSLAVALFRFGGAPMPDPTTNFAAPTAPPPAAAPPAAPATDAAPEPSDDAKPKEPAPEAVPAWATGLIAKVDQLMALIAPPKPVAEPAAAAPVAAPAGPPAQMAADAPAAKLSATDEAELAARRLGDAARTKAEAIEALCGSAVAKLAAWHLDDATRGEIRRVAESGGAPALDAFVATYQRVAPRDPRRRLEDVIGSGAVQTDPPEVAAFAARGPTALEHARAAHGRWQSLKSSGYPVLPLGQFLSTEVRA